jgi:hypothetical protein
MGNQSELHVTVRWSPRSGERLTGGRRVERCRTLIQKWSVHQ